MNIFLSTNDAGLFGIHLQKYKLYHICHTFKFYFKFCTKTASKWIIGLNMHCKAINLQDESIGENLSDLGFGGKFLNITAKA